MRYHATVGERTALVERTEFGALVDGVEVAFAVEVIGPRDLHLTLPERSARVVGEKTGEGWRITIRGRDYIVDIESERARAIRELTGRDEASGPSDLMAPMPGLVVKVLVEPGQVVRAGDGLVVVEAMKMENELRAAADGRVTGVEVAPGQAVERDELLVRFGEVDG
jgi:biotin carboxyl carrier protein